jgi:transporter family-2 protein
MYYFLSLLTGILISVMVALNGGLTVQYGVYSATVIVHITGLILISILLLSKHERPFIKRHTWFLYLGGIIGVFTTVFNNFAFGRISVSAILALGLFGQSITGLLIDQYGFLGMPKHPFSKQKLFGLFLILSGIALMINSFEVLAVAVSFAAGVCIVISRTLNAKLADLTSVWVSTFYNYLFGLVLAIFVFFILGRNELNSIKLIISPNLYIYFGGMIGVCVVYLSNITVAKISAFYLTLLIFVAQVFSGVLIDILISQEFSSRNLIGGMLVAIGLCVNLLLDNKNKGNHAGQA